MMKTNIKTSGFFTLITLISLLFTSNSAFAQETNKVTYVKVEVDGLSCPFCAYGLEKNLKKVTGAKDVFINVKDGYATFTAPKDFQPTKDELKKVVKDAGFTAREISYSDKPFAKNKE